MSIKRDAAICAEMLRKKMRTKYDLEKFCIDNTNLNVEFPTQGGNVWWKDLYDVDGWRIQQNIVFGNYRIIDEKNIRRAFFVADQMIIALEKW